MTGLKRNDEYIILYLCNVLHHSQSLDLLDFFWHAVPLVSQTSCHREAMAPWVNKSEVLENEPKRVYRFERQINIRMRTLGREIVNIHKQTANNQHNII